ncbi:MAG: lipoate--protein ligase family protein [Chthoniobacterales bacterium]|nr:lipoate--protein ligase family protein [Chthoniobacterales bacterium]
MLFERLLVHDGRGAADAALNMAIDEALLEGASLPILRFYGWRRPSLSFGYFGKFSDVAADRERRDIVRRWTGGGSVLHGEDLTYALVTPATESAAALAPATIYAALHSAIRDALLTNGQEAELAPTAAPKISDACFANPVRDDVMLRGRKIAGAAQRRTRGGFLHQGSIQLPGLDESFRERFAAALAPEVRRGEISPTVLERAATLAAGKYATEEWLRRW